MRIAAAVAAMLFVVAITPPAGAQEPKPAPRTVIGVVRDSTTGQPIAAALVKLGQRQVLTNATGRFRFERVPDGPAPLSVWQLGYALRTVTVDIGAELAPLALALAPDPVLLTAINVVADSVVARRLAHRRYSLAVASHAFDRKTLAAANAQDLHSFVGTRTGLQVAACAGDRMARMLAGRGPIRLEAFGGSGWTGCIWKRGLVLRSVVYIDEKPIPVAQLHDYALRDMYLLEVYDSGVMIRGYTTAWVERTRAERLGPIP